MKIKPEHYQHIKTELGKLDRDIVITHAKQVLAEGKFKDFHKRMAWVMFHGATLTEYCCDTLYPYMNDDHVNTALKAINKELGYTEIFDNMMKG